MKIFYSDNPLDLDAAKHSIFLVGPTPRSKTVESWRPYALDILDKLGYRGQVIVPEWRVVVEDFNYDGQVEWEHTGLENCSAIACWVPRDLKDMPAFTTNVEFGRYVRSGRLFYGRPDSAPKNRYLDWLYKKYNNHTVHNNLIDLMKNAIELSVYYENN